MPQTGCSWSGNPRPRQIVFTFERGFRLISSSLLNSVVFWSFVCSLGTFPIVIGSGEHGELPSLVIDRFPKGSRGTVNLALKLESRFLIFRCRGKQELSSEKKLRTSLACSEDSPARGIYTPDETIVSYVPWSEWGRLGKLWDLKRFLILALRVFSARAIPLIFPMPA